MINFRTIEKKWQEKWESSRVFAASEDTKKKKFYCLEMFPYPSGSGLHMGHAFNYTIGDIHARFMRMKGFSVLYPMGYDSFGLPAENAAIKAKVHPRDFTDSAIANFIKQQKELGLSYDWERKISTCSHEYYRWNQFFFLKLMEKGLVYRKKAPVNWCPECSTVLANEQVHEGKCWRHKETEVEKKMLEQWFIKTTEYAEELLEKLSELEWPERIKSMQENWIGKSHGLTIKFDVVDESGKKFDEIETFTTRPDTVYGITYLVLSAEHPKVIEWTKGTERESEVNKFIRSVEKQSIIERTAEGKEKNGIFLGKYFINPFTGDKCPLWAADYALYDYGTGAVMAVPTHDQRDFEFAKKYSLPLKAVISPSDWEIDTEKMSRAYIEDGVLVNSGSFNGMGNRDAINAISDFGEKQGFARKTVSYKLKDWLVSRQRYWGTPIPAVHCSRCGIVPVPYENLPVMLPENVKFGDGNPLETSREFLDAECPKCRGKARRETDTMDTFFDSSWYFLRYCDPKNENSVFETEKAEYWMPVDQYIGGAEHACMHLIYARFFTKALRDMGLISFDEPFSRLFNQGMLHGEDGFVMSKSRGNVVLPETVSEKYGIDTARLFLVSIASPDKDLEWSDAGIEGSLRFMRKVISYFDSFSPGDSDRRTESRLNKAIMGITGDIASFRYNMAVIKLRELFDSFESNVSKDTAEKFLKLLSPFCPHVAEELWEKIGNEGFVSIAEWPKYDESKIDLNAEAADNTVASSISDIRNVQKIAGIKNPKKIRIIISAEWKYEFASAMKRILAKTFNTGEIIPEIMKDSKLKTHGLAISKLIPKIVKDPSKLPDIVLSQNEESRCFSDAEEKLKKEFSSEIEIITEEKSNDSKAGSAMPGKPAIILE